MRKSLGWLMLAGLVHAQWLDVPYVRQIEAGCGAASIAMVMQYWSHETPELGVATDAMDGDRIYRLLAGSSGKGISGESLKQYLSSNGFDAYAFNGELRDIEQHLAKGRPLVVCLAPRGSRQPLHYVVVVGKTDKVVTMHDPTRGKLFQEDLPRFQKEWKATGNWTLLAVPRRAH